MKSFALSTILFFASMLSTSALAYDSSDLTTSFTLGDVGPTVITKKMIDKMQKSAVANAKELLHAPNDPIAGNPNGSVTFVQLVDFFCPTSEKMDPDIQTIIRANPDLRVVYKPFPLRGSVSAYASKAALAANKQGKYLELHTALMREHGDLSKEKIISIAKKVGLDIKKLMAEMQDKKYDRQIDASHILAKKMGVIGTPTFFFAKTNLTQNDTPDSVILLLGKMSKDDLQSAIEGTPP